LSLKDNLVKNTGNVFGKKSNSKRVKNDNLTIDIL